MTEPPRPWNIPPGSDLQTYVYHHVPSISWEQARGVLEGVATYCREVGYLEETINLPYLGQATMIPAPLWADRLTFHWIPVILATREVRANIGQQIGGRPVSAASMAWMQEEGRRRSTPYLALWHQVPEDARGDSLTWHTLDHVMRDAYLEHMSDNQLLEEIRRRLNVQLGGGQGD